MQTMALCVDGKETVINIDKNNIALPQEAQNGALVTDETVYQIYKSEIERLIRGRGIEVCVFKDGEQMKSKESLFRLYDFFIKAGINRASYVIAFGGGVAGDLCGLAASTFMRGTRFIQIPTTLTAQIDSCIGGKSSINYGGLKNIIGTFYQPDYALIATDYLSTLPARDIRAGMAEAVKYAFIYDPSIISSLGSVEDAIAPCVKAKASFVLEDPLDAGRRRMLNFGHTFGHAIEELSDFKLYRHGEAVAMGMRMAAYISSALGFLNDGSEGELQRLLEEISYPKAFEGSIAQLLPYMANDKKNQQKKAISLVLLKKAGDPFIYQTTEDELARVFKGTKNE